jgi:hypothetical protein
MARLGNLQRSTEGTGSFAAQGNPFETYGKRKTLLGAGRPALVFWLSCVVALSFFTARASGQSTTQPTPQASAAPAARDGECDFDFEAGTWKIHLKRLVHPLTGSTTWVEFDGTSVTRKVWDGKAWLEEFETSGPSGKVEGLTLRLYNPQAHQWRLYWANSKDGLLGPPTIGEFRDGRGEFYDQEDYNGRSILVRYIWSGITANSAHFEQSFSTDGGKTWEVNWITDQVRVAEK